MPEQKEVPIPSQLTNLRRLEEFLVAPGSEYLHIFGRLLADRISPRETITRLAFVITAELLLADLQRGTDGFTGKPLTNTLTSLSDQFYLLLRPNILTIAEAVYPKDFADQVKQIYQNLGEKRRA